MPTFDNIEKKCAVCGHIQKCDVLISTSSFGPMDLDTRPAAPKRHTVIYEMEICEKCHYAHEDIEHFLEGLDKNLVFSSSYEAMATDKSIDENARKFILAGYLYKKCNDLLSSGLAYLQASWVFDDLNQPEYAKRTRKKSLENLFNYAEETGDMNIAVLTVDLQRRIGDFEGAIETAEQLIGFGAEDLLLKVLKYEINLCKINDDKCHNISEA